MEDVVKKPFWKNFIRAHNHSWGKSIRWPLMLVVSGCLLLATLAVFGLAYGWISGSVAAEKRGLAAGILIAGGAALWLVNTIIIYACLERFIMRRVEALLKDAGKVNGGDFQHRLEVERPDELGQVAEQINLLAGGLGRREAMLAKAHEKVLADTQFKSDVLAKVSHDLRQPLGVILGFSEMIRDEVVGPLNNQQRRAMSEIISSTARLSQMVTDLLDSSRLESHNLNLRVDDFSPGLLLRQVKDQVRAQADHKGLALVTELDPQLPNTLRGDPSRLLTILNNLTVNAIKFTEQGSIHIRMFRPDADHWAFSVADTGVGISADAIEHIFEPFWQGNNLANQHKGGVGLGLSIVQQFVQLMNGQIQVESAVGVGSTIRITLPLEHCAQGE